MFQIIFAWLLLQHHGKTITSGQVLPQTAIDDKAKWGFLQSQGILISDEPRLPAEAKVAHMYPGQGSQYVGMTFDLYKRYTQCKRCGKNPMKPWLMY